MIKYIIILAILINYTTSIFADNIIMPRIISYIQLHNINPLSHNFLINIDNGNDFSILQWNYTNLIPPSSASDLPPLNLALLPLKYKRIITNDVNKLEWQELTNEEKIQVDIIEAEVNSQIIHNAKPLDQKLLENSFFDLTEHLLTLKSDPRTNQTPRVKLGFAEIEQLIESLPEESVLIGIKMSLKLLSIDSALKRYNTLWWDNARYDASIIQN